MPVSITHQPTGINYLNDCPVWGLSITGVVDETKDERGLYRLMGDAGVITDWVSLPPVGNISVNFTKEIAGVLTTPVPGFTNSIDASSMKQKFWLEYGDIVFDKEACTKTENLGNTSGQSEFVNGVKQPGQSAAYTMRPDYMQVPRYEYYDYIFSDAGSANFTIKLCTGQVVGGSTGGSGEITGFGVGTANSPVSAYIDTVVYYDVSLGGLTYRFHVVDGEPRAFNDYKVSTSHNRVSMVMFLEPSGGYSCMPVEYLTSTQQSMTFDEVCVYDGCNTNNRTIFNKETRAVYEFEVRSPRTQQFGIWVQHMAAATKYFVLYRNSTGAKEWVPFVVTNVREGFGEDFSVRFSGYININNQG